MNKFVFESQKELLDELSKMPPMVIATAYLHALNYTMYGEDVTEKWLTATQNAAILEKAYHQGYSDAMQRRAESEDVLNKIQAEINTPNRGTCDYFIVDRIEEIINKYKAGSEE